MIDATDATVDEMEEKSKRNSKKVLEELNQYNKDHVNYCIYIYIYIYTAEGTHDIISHL